jgi:apolipoprotein N-acyltransferase
MNRLRGILLCAASGVLMALSLPQAFPWLSLREIDPAGHLEWLAWFALVPALLALDAVRTWKGALGVGLASGLAYFYASIWWVSHAMTAFGGVPVPLAFVALTLLVFYMAAHWAGAFVVSFAIRRRLGWPLWTHLPAVWVAFELCRNYLFSGFPWANLGYTQARHVVVAQIAAIAGVYGIAFLVVLVNSALHAVARAALDRRRIPWRPPAVAAALAVAAVAFGEAHLAAVRARAAAAPRLKVGIVQGNVNQAVKNERLRNADAILDRYLPLTLEADRRGVDLVVWPEAAYPYLVPPDLPSFAARRIGLPRLHRAHLLLGAGTYSAHRASDGRVEATGSNSVFLLGPDLRVLGRYAKHHLVPFGEYVPLSTILGGVLRAVVPEMVQQVPGETLEPLVFAPLAPVAANAPPGGAAGEAVRLAPMICYDAIFPEINVAFAREDPGVLVNPTNDAWYGYSSGPYQFLAMVRLRAIEAGKAVVRPAYAGVSALVDPTGEVQQGALPVGPVDPDLAPDPEEPPRLLVGEVPRLRGRTPYTTYGDVFAVAASLYGAVALALASRRGRSPSPQGAPS